MRTHRRAGAILSVFLIVCAAGAADRIHGQGATPLPMPCRQMLDERAFAAVSDPGFELTSATMPSPGTSQCTWQDARETPTRRVGIRFVDRRGFPAAAPTSAGALDAAMAPYVKMGLKPEAIPGLGELALAYTVSEATILLIRRADGVLTVRTSGSE